MTPECAIPYCANMATTDLWGFQVCESCHNWWTKKALTPDRVRMRHNLKQRQTDLQRFTDAQLEIPMEGKDGLG